MLQNKSIRVEHLVYLIIIFVITLSFFLVISFGDLPNANGMLAVAGTVSSIILAVIAIVMSLIDVAGQRQSIIDLKETAEKLDEATNATHIKMDETIMQLSELEAIKDQIILDAEENKKWKDEILYELTEITNKESNQTLEDIIVKLKEEKEETDLWKYKFSKESFSRNVMKVLSDLKRNSKKDVFDYDYIIIFLSGHFFYETKVKFEHTLERLHNEGKIMISPPNNTIKILG